MPLVSWAIRRGPSLTSRYAMGRDRRKSKLRKASPGLPFRGGADSSGKPSYDHAELICMYRGSRVSICRSAHPALPPTYRKRTAVLVVA